MEYHIIFFVFYLVLAGVFAGFAAGLFGIGGGTVLVPVLLYVFSRGHVAPNVVMDVTVGTSLALVIPASIMSVRKHSSFGNFDSAYFKTWVPMVIVGAIAGVFLTRFVPDASLKWMFMVYLYICVAFSFFKVYKRSIPEGKPHGLMKYLVGGLIGAVSSMLGMGGGPFTVPFHRAFNYSIRRCIAVSSATAICIGIVGVIGAIFNGFGASGRPVFSLGYVNVLAVFIIAPISTFCSALGAKATVGMRRRHLSMIYTVFLLLVALFMTWQVFYG